MTTLAAVALGAGEQLVVDEIDVGRPGTGEVRVGVRACGVCHTDVTWADGTLDPDPYGFPVVLGHEAAGVVEDVGAGVTDVRVGDHVVVALTHHCGQCAACESGHPMLCRRRDVAPPRYRRGGTPVRQGFGVGGFAEATVVPQASVVAVGAELPWSVAALLGCAVATGFGAVDRIARVELGARVLVLGCGAVGASVALAAVTSGASVTVVDPDEQRRALAAALGAGVTAADLGEVGDGYDFVFEATGVVDVMGAAVTLAAPGGTVTLLGVPAGDSRVSFPALDFVASQRRVLGCITGDHRPHVDIPRYERLYREGRLPLDQIVTRTVTLDQFPCTLRELTEGSVRTVVVPPSSGS